MCFVQERAVAVPEHKSAADICFDLELVLHVLSTLLRLDATAQYVMMNK